MLSQLPRPIRHLAILIVASSLIACGTTKKGYAPGVQVLPASEVAVLKVSPNDQSSFSVVYDEDGNEVRRTNVFSESLNEIVVKPGNYEVVMTVSGGYQQMDAHPRVYATVRAGKTYLFATSKVLDGRAVRVQYAEAPAEAAAK